jgi:tetraacyldisaccharide 4'-kinase
MRPIFKHAEEVSLNSIGNRPILLITGIASPKQMLSDLGQYSKNISILEFPDHHYFNKKDIEAIRNKFCEINKNNDAFIVTTEKDTVRLMSIKDIPQDVADNLYMLPVEVEFMLDKEELFNDNIIGHVRKNSRNSILHKGKDANKS